MDDAWYRDQAASLSDLGLDLVIAETAARWDVFAAHGLTEVTDGLTWLLWIYDDVRRSRKALSEAVDDALMPSVNLGRLDDEDDRE